MDLIIGNMGIVRKILIRRTGTERNWFQDFWDLSKASFCLRKSGVVKKLVMS